MFQKRNLRMVFLSLAVVALLSAVFVTPARANNVNQFFNTFANNMGNSVGNAAGQSVGNSIFGNPAPHGLIAGAIDDPSAKNKPANYRSNYVAPDSPSPDSVYGDSGSNCRQYPQKFTVNGRAQTYLRTACQQPDGTWRVVQ